MNSVIDIGNHFSFLAGDLKTEIGKLYFIAWLKIIFTFNTKNAVLP